MEHGDFEGSMLALEERIILTQKIIDNLPNARIFKNILKNLICRAILYHEQNGHCKFCNIRMFADYDFGNPPKSRRATIEHIICKSAKGPNEIQNYVLSCERCNKARGTIEYEVFSAMTKSAKWEDIPRLAKILKMGMK